MVLSPVRVDPKCSAYATNPQRKCRHLVEFDRLADGGELIQSEPFANHPSKANWHRTRHRRYGNMDGDMGANSTHADVSLWVREMDLSAARMD